MWNQNTELKHLDSAWLNVSVSSSRQMTEDIFSFFFKNWDNETFGNPKAVIKIDSIQHLRVLFGESKQVTFYWFEYNEKLFFLCLLSNQLLCTSFPVICFSKIHEAMLCIYSKDGWK